MFIVVCGIERLVDLTQACASSIPLKFSLVCYRPSAISESFHVGRAAAEGLFSGETPSPSKFSLGLHTGVSVRAAFLLPRDRGRHLFSVQRKVLLACVLQRRSAADTLGPDVVS